MEKQWKQFGDECPRCGNESKVLTDSSYDWFAYDGDDAKCVECGLQGSVSADGDEDGCIGHVSWNDFDIEE